MALPPRGMRNSNNLPFQSCFVAVIFTVPYGTVFKAKKLQNKVKKHVYMVL